MLTSLDFISIPLFTMCFCNIIKENFYTDTFLCNKILNLKSVINLAKETINNLPHFSTVSFARYKSDNKNVFKKFQVTKFEKVRYFIINFVSCLLLCKICSISKFWKAKNQTTKNFMKYFIL